MKVTEFTVIIFAISLFSCTRIDKADEKLAFQQKVDSAASKKIDSAYKKIMENCDTAQKYRLPALVDSILKADTISIQTVIKRS